MIIDFISDLHGHYPKLEGGDLLIIAGDLTARDTTEENGEFLIWAISRAQKQYKKVVFIAGNHDNFIYERRNFQTYKHSSLTYLCDSRTEFEGLKIWGSPWTKTFEGMNPKCKAFTVDTEEELASKFSLIPDDIDILVTHSPPYGTLDEIYYEEFSSDENHTPVFSKNVGSGSLAAAMLFKFSLKLHIFGHIHEAYGITHSLTIPANKYRKTYVNASLVNEHYQPVNKPIRLIL